MNSGFISAHITFALLAFLLLPTRNLTRRIQLAVLAGCGALGFLTIEGLSLGDYTRSYTDDLAITTLLWLAWCTASRLRISQPLSSQHHLQLALCFAGLAVFLYPATLGLTQVDPYRLGFSPLPMLLGMWLLGVWLWTEGNRLVLGMIGVATASYVLDVKASDNYWDYLIDPILGLYCLAYLIGRLQLLLRRKVSLAFVRMRRPVQQSI